MMKTEDKVILFFCTMLGTIILCFGITLLSHGQQFPKGWGKHVIHKSVVHTRPHKITRRTWRMPK